MENKKQPPKYKTAIMIWMVIYPTINLIFYIFGDVLNTFVLPLRTLILTLILVPLMVYVLLPLAGRILKGWLHS
jgi:antibiotic biosynthesis monooxygenase (ABM) superfamily enzyme